MNKKINERQRERKERFRSLVDNTTDWLCEIDNDIVYTYVSQKIKALLGYEPEEVIGKTLFCFMPTEERKRFKRYFQHIIKCGKPFVELESIMLHKDGRLVTLEISGVPFFYTEGQFQGYRCIGYDITNRKQAEDALREHEEFSSNLLNHAPNPILVINHDSSIRYVNPALERLTGFSHSDLVGTKPPYPWWPKETREKASMDLHAILEHGLQRVEEFCIGKEGVPFWIEVTSVSVKHHGNLQYYLSNWVDITEQKRLREDMQFYINKMTMAQEAERKRIARDLHDDTIQSLSDLYADIDELIQSGDKLGSQDYSRLEQFQRKLSRIIRETRRFSHELRPGILDRLGIIPSIELLIAETQNSGLNCRFDVIGPKQRLCPDAELMLFRITQEALNNARRHSKASGAVVKLEFTSDIIKLEVTDDGIGFRLPKTLSSFASKGNLGLIGMKERATLLNGSFSVKSEVSKGTTVAVTIPT